MHRTRDLEVTVRRPVRWLSVVVALVAGLGTGACFGGESLPPNFAFQLGPPPGPEPGRVCGPDGALACTDDDTARLHCEAGSWKKDADCLKFQQCREQEASGKVVTTSCDTLPTTRTPRAIACAKVAHCLPGGSFVRCMDPRPVTTAGIGQPLDMAPVAELMLFEVDSRLACLKVANNCKEVLNCFSGSVPACATDGDDACIGTVARTCFNGATMATDCAGFELPCTEIMKAGEKKALCARATPCTPSGGVSCWGSVATACLPDSSIQVAIDCFHYGGTCDAKGTPDDDAQQVCKFGVGGCGGVMADSCKGSVLTRCRDGQVQSFDCSVFGASCEVRSGFPNDGEGFCTTSPGCPNFAAGCKGGAILFCDGMSGLRSFSCNVAGMVCLPGASKCTFSLP